MSRTGPRLDAPGYVGLRRYFLTFCTHKRRSRFTAPEIVDAVHGQILRTGLEMQVEEIAYCFMPDHVHLLVQGCSDDADCLAFVNLAKQRSGFAFSQLREGRLWQTGFHDRILRDGDSSRRFIKYILQNPVRAGLVTNVSDYPFAGSSR